MFLLLVGRPFTRAFLSSEFLFFLVGEIGIGVVVVFDAAVVCALTLGFVAVAGRGGAVV